MTKASDPRAYSPAVQRNRDPILSVLSRVLPPAGLILEIASGSGEHAAYFAAALPGILWQPTEFDPRAFASIEAHRQSADLPNIRPPAALDVASPDWPVARAEGLVCINMIHISPWQAAEGLMKGAARILPPGGVLYLYGPFKEQGRHTAPSNEAFDASLRSRDPRWGVRGLEEVIALASLYGLAHSETVIMPANNRSVIFHRNG